MSDLTKSEVYSSFVAFCARAGRLGLGWAGVRSEKNRIYRFTVDCGPKKGRRAAFFDCEDQLREVFHTL
jgi:hypothetical protein